MDFQVVLQSWQSFLKCKCFRLSNTMASGASSAHATDSMLRDGLCLGGCGFPACGKFWTISSDIEEGLMAYNLDIRQWCCGACARYWLEMESSPSVENSRRSEYQHGPRCTCWHLTGDEEMELEDLEDEKPGDWVDTHVMDDPEDSKPDDWVTEKRVVDGEAEKPDDLDDEEDGEWEAPTKDNPEYKSDTSVGESANFTVVESVESATASTDQPMDPAEAYVYAPVDTLRHCYCINGACDRLAAPGYDSCCRPCSDSAGVQHSRRCPQRDALRCLAFTPKA